VTGDNDESYLSIFAAIPFPLNPLTPFFEINDDFFLIVAKGADNIRIKKEIIDAVTRALDVPSHRVAVMAKK